MPEMAPGEKATSPVAGATRVTPSGTSDRTRTLSLRSCEAKLDTANNLSPLMF
jgi:hypothetical protein